MTDKQIFEKAKKEVVAHYNRMINQTRKFDKTNTHFSFLEHEHEEVFINRKLMFDAIGESWTSPYCAFCTNYYTDDGSIYYVNDYVISCEKCPLYKIGEPCGASNSLWQKMNSSYSWRNWVTNANVLLREIKNIKWEDIKE